MAGFPDAMIQLRGAFDGLYHAQQSDLIGCSIEDETTAASPLRNQHALMNETLKNLGEEAFLDAGSHSQFIERILVSMGRGGEVD